MERVTYPDAAVEDVIQRSFIPVQYNVATQPEAMDMFNTPWTPTLIVQDAEGREHRRSQGYLDAKRFVAEMALARMKEAIDRRDYPAAYALIGETLESVKGDPYREPEGMYWAAVATYKAKDEGLLDGWNRLIEQYPDSEWAKRVEFIRM